MQDSFKVAATGIVWTVVLLVLGSAIWAPVAGGTEISSGVLMTMVLILGAVAAISTSFIWRSNFQTPPMMNSGVEKAKRVQADPRERLLRTLGALDDDEAAAMLDDLKSRLYGGDSDGEVSAVEMLRQERRRN